MQKTILIADDEQDILDLIEYNLVKNGYRVLSARDGRQALQHAQLLPDLILLDIMMPELDGFEVCRELKRSEQTKGIPIVFLTARESEFDEVVGLELGAEDYIVKPVQMGVLLARVRSLFRRRESPETAIKHVPDLIRIEKLEINLPNYSVTIDRSQVFFTRKEFGTLVYLVTHRGRVISRENLLNGVWERGVQVVDRTIDVHISKIREKLGRYGDYVETVKGIGYRFRL